MGPEEDTGREEARIRLFTAIAVPDDAARLLSSLPQSLKGHWTPPADYHITLRFMGEPPAERLEDIAKALESRVRRPAFRLEVEGLGRFDRRNETVLWAAIASTRKLTALTAEINESLAPLGFEMPSRPYTPHITLARLPGKAVSGVDDYIRTRKAGIRAGWQVAAFHLYASGTPGPQGQRYEILRTFQLPPPK